MSISQNTLSFHSRVKNTLIQCAEIYNSFYVKYDYLIIADAFKKNPYYIISAQEDNYLHLTGVSTNLSAKQFFHKCISKTLSESDFKLKTHGKSEKDSKGTIRQKIRNLPLISYNINSSCLIQENFKHNAVLCSFASSTAKCTLGFIASPDITRPLSLLNGDIVDHSVATPIKLCLSKPQGVPQFNKIEIGTIHDLSCNYQLLKGKISKKLVLEIMKYRIKQIACAV